MTDNNIQAYIARAATYCSKAEKCEQDVRQKLHQWGAEVEWHDKVIEHLIKERYIDEHRYARAYARDKFQFNKWGRIKISMMLRVKQISAEAIMGALSAIDEEQYMQTLVQVIESKKSTIKAKTVNEHDWKLVSYAASKGFELNLAREALSLLRS